MAARKSRSRKTADRMAAYKERMSKSHEVGSRSSKHPTRRSPRKAGEQCEAVGSTTSSPPRCREASNRSNQKEPSDEYREDGFSKKDDPLRQGTGRLEDLVEIPETPPRASQGLSLKQTLAPPSDEYREDGDDQLRQDAGRLEDLVEIPETPPRTSQVLGRKRTLAPHSLGYLKDGACGDSDDSQKPSKKRKSFNTPPRTESRNTCNRTVNDKDGSHQDPTLTPDTLVMSRSRKGVLNTELFDEDSAPSSEIGKGSDPIRSGWASRFPNRDKNGTGTSLPPVSDGELEYVSTSTQAISRHFNAIKKQVLEEMRALYQQQKSDLRELHKSELNPLLSEMRDMRSVMGMMYSGTKGSGLGKLSRSGPKTSLHEWEEKLNHLTPKAEVVFSKEVFARILCFNAPWKVCEVFENGVGDLGSRVSAAAQVLLFSHQPSSKKNDFSDGFGKLHSEFKYSVVQNSFYNVCKRDTFDLFRSTGIGSSPGASAVSIEKTDQCRISRPKWLQPGYVSVDHINDARNFMESTNQSRKAKIRGTPSPDDIGSHGALRVYRQLGAHLHRGQDHMKIAFFQNLGYLFSSWKDPVKESDQAKMILSFPYEDAGRLSVLRLEDIPCTDLCTFGADTEKTNQVNAGNRDLMKRMFSGWPNLVLCAEYEVEVLRTGVGQKRRPIVEKRKLRRLINLIEVSCNVLVEYTRVGNTDMLLRGHKYALRCVMIFALLIRELTSEFIAMRAAIEPDLEDPQKTVPDAELVVVHNTHLKTFLPGKSVVDAQLRPKFLRITEKMYDTWHVEEDDGEPEQPERSGDHFVVTEIAESDELGVAAI